MWKGHMAAFLPFRGATVTQGCLQHQGQSSIVLLLDAGPRGNFSPWMEQHGKTDQKQVISRKHMMKTPSIRGSSLYNYDIIVSWRKVPLVSVSILIWFFIFKCCLVNWNKKSHSHQARTCNLSGLATAWWLLDLKPPHRIRPSPSKRKKQDMSWVMTYHDLDSVLWSISYFLPWFL